MMFRRGLFFFTAVFCGAMRLFSADSDLHGIADDSALRVALAATLFIAPPSDVLREKPRVVTLVSGERVAVRIERGASRDEFSIILAREHSGAFTGWGQGSFILTRRIEDGAPLRARIFLRSDPYTYVQFRPLNQSKSEMDALVYNGFLVQALPVPLSFEKLLVTPLNETLDSLGNKFPRRYFEPKSDDYRATRTLIREIRREIRALKFKDDGAIDENGNYVLIRDLSAQNSADAGLNCSGFAKWVIDGLLRPLTGTRLKIETLKAPFGVRGTSFTAPYERSRDPYFGLDWVRNLAAAAEKTLKSPAFSVLEECEVRRTPFQALLIRSGRTSAIRQYPGFLPDAGFSFEGIHPLLYTLAIDEPESFFLGTISVHGGRPALRTYFHVAVLMPYFDENSVFHVAVFESAEETSFNRFRVRYPSHHINLCRIPVETAFTP
jgi:hypothetical protein